MAVCDLCGAEFDPSEAEDEIESEFGILSYGNLEKTLCGECAIEVINCKVDGVYFETCERCEKRFDYIEDSARVENELGYTLTGYSTITNDHFLCFDCASEVASQENGSF